MWDLDHKEGWAPKNWCFWTVVLEKTLESPLNCKEFIQPVNPKGDQPWLEGLMLKRKLQHLGYLMWRADSLEKTRCWERLRAGGGGDDRGGGGWMASLTQWTWIWTNSRRYWRTGKPGVPQSMPQRIGHDWRTEQQWEFPPPLDFNPLPPPTLTHLSPLDPSLTLTWIPEPTSPSFSELLQCCVPPLSYMFSLVLWTQPFPLALFSFHCRVSLGWGILSNVLGGEVCISGTCFKLSYHNWMLTCYLQILTRMKNMFQNSF